MAESCDCGSKSAWESTRAHGRKAGAQAPGAASKRASWLMAGASHSGQVPEEEVVNRDLARAQRGDKPSRLVFKSHM